MSSTEGPQRAQAPTVKVVDGSPIALDDVLRIARGSLRVELSSSAEYRARLKKGRRVLEALETGGTVIYGVTTGVGHSSSVEIPDADRDELPANLVRFHGCGTGRALEEREAAAVVALRLIALARGYSGVRPELVERLCVLLNERVFPVIPEEGSVGASGDLTPLSYLAALVMGEREALCDGLTKPAVVALRAAGLDPFPLEIKESLALMNGSAVMTAIASLVWERSLRLARLAAAVTAAAVDVTCGNRGHFDPRIFQLKAHPGQIQAAAWIRDDLEWFSRRDIEPARLQDPYSIRCAPHVIGVLLDTLTATRQTLEIEIHSVDDNPLIDPESGDVLHGGNFYGGHICQAMDGLKSAAASVADLLDRQLVLLCRPETSGGLPANLVRSGRVTEHGFKAMQITTSALTAEAQKLTMPAAAFSRSTESHNQDKVSMGTIAARDARRVVELAETVASIALLAVCQALDLRDGGHHLGPLLALRDAVRKSVPTLERDRRQDRDIARVLELLRGDNLPLGQSTLR